jgi:hypothetical protein
MKNPAPPKRSGALDEPDGATPARSGSGLVSVRLRAGARVRSARRLIGDGALGELDLELDHRRDHRVGDLAHELVTEGVVRDDLPVVAGDRELVEDRAEDLHLQLRVLELTLLAPVLVEHGVEGGDVEAEGREGQTAVAADDASPRDGAGVLVVQVDVHGVGDLVDCQAHESNRTEVGPFLHEPTLETCDTRHGFPP